MLSGTDILIAEDSKTQALQLQDLLEQAGCHVRLAGDGVEALRLLEEKHPMIIISDVVMPNMSGYEFCKAVKSNPETKAIPVILVTSLTDPRDVVHGLACGADNFITKPYEARYLLSRLKYFLSNLELRDSERVKMGMEVMLEGERHFITAARQQILDLLISTYEEGIRLNRELKSKHEDLSQSHSLINSMLHFTSGLSSVQSSSEVVEKALAEVMAHPGVSMAWVLFKNEEEQDGGWYVSDHQGSSSWEPKPIPAGAPCPCVHAYANDHDNLKEVTCVCGCPALEGLFENPCHATVPLTMGGEVIGLLNAVNDTGTAWGEEPMEALRSVGQQTSIALGRARLFDSLETLVAQRTAALKTEMVERERAQEALNRNLVQLRLLNRAIESSVNAVLIADCRDEDYPIVYANPAFEKMTGYSFEDVKGHNSRFLQGEDPDQQGVKQIRRALKAREEGHALLHNYRKNGASFWNELYVAPVADSAGQVTHFIGVMNDVTDSKHYQEQLEHQANYDDLTGLPNRNLLMDRIQQAIFRANRSKLGFTLGLLDLDNFKYINDSLGHDTGDRLLTQLAQRLRDCLGYADTVARLGGDEFIILINDESHAPAVSKTLTRILGDIARPFQVDNAELRVTGSIGFCVYPADGEDATTLLMNADTAMYQAKNQGRNRLCGYTQEMNEYMLQRMALERDLRKGIENDELELFYQPLLDVQSHRVVAVEALVRWRKDDRYISPVDFIPLAEETGLIKDIDTWVLEQACKQNKLWLDQGLPIISISVNFSAWQFEEEGCLARVAQVLKDNDLDPSLLKVEVTESMVMRNAGEALKTMNALRAMKVQLSMDDFGTGYSSLSYLKTFPFNQLKIDKAFVANVVNDPEDAAVIRTIIELARSLDMQVVAEGVETEEQFVFMSRAGCDLIQGYFFSRPLPAEAATLFLQQDQEEGNESARQGNEQTINRTLLIVDEDKRSLKALAREMQREGYELLLADSAELALQLLAKHEVQVVLVEQRMKEMKGVDFLRRLKGLYPSTVRMVISGYTDLESLLPAINEGAIYRFVTKPWEADHLREHIKQAFRESDLLWENYSLRQQLLQASREEIKHIREQRFGSEEMSED